MPLNKDIQEYTKNPPERILKKEDGRIVGFVGEEELMSPQYKRCHICELRTTCSRVQTDEDGNYLDKECVIEKDFVKLFFSILNERGNISSVDSMLITPALQSLFRMRRFYAWESTTDMIRTMRNPEEFMHYKRVLSVLHKAEAQYTKFLKEIFTTSKEEMNGSTEFIIRGKNNDLASELSDYTIEDDMDIDYEERDEREEEEDEEDE